MAYISEFGLICLSEYIIYHSWQIILCHLRKRVLEIRFTSLQFFVSSAVDISSVVSKPNIVALLEECKGQRIVTHNKILSTGHQTVL